MCTRWGRDGRGEGLRRATRRREEERRTCWIYSWNGSVTEVVWHTRASCRNGPPAWRPGRWSWGDARGQCRSFARSTAWIHSLDRLLDAGASPSAQTSLLLTHSARPSQCPSYGETPCVIRILDPSEAARPRSGLAFLIQHRACRLPVLEQTPSLARSLPAPPRPACPCPCVPV